MINKYVAYCQNCSWTFTSKSFDISTKKIKEHFRNNKNCKKILSFGCDERYLSSDIKNPKEIECPICGTQNSKIIDKESYKCNKCNMNIPLGSVYCFTYEALEKKGKNAAAA